MDRFEEIEGIRDKIFSVKDFKKDNLIDKYTKELSDIEDRMEELSRIPEDEFDEKPVQEELDNLKERESELERKIKEIEEGDY